MRAFIRKFENDWDLLLSMVEFAYNTQVHSTMGYKPFTLQFEHAPMYPIDITLQTSNPELVTPDEYTKMVHERMAEIFQIVNEKRQESEEKQVIDYNTMHSTQVFEKEQYILLLEHQRKEQFNQKFAQRTQEDVFLVKEVISEQTYKIKNTKTRLILKNSVHGSQLRPYYQRKNLLREEKSKEQTTQLDPGRGHQSIQYQIIEEQKHDRKLEY